MGMTVAEIAMRTCGTLFGLALFVAIFVIVGLVHDFIRGILWERQLRFCPSCGNRKNTYSDKNLCIGHTCKIHGIYLSGGQ